MTDTNIVIAAAKRLDPVAWSAEALSLTDSKLARELADRRKNTLQIVKSVIQTLKEPTEKMLEVGFLALPTPRPYDTRPVRASFVACMDQALGEAEILTASKQGQAR
jgi:hypothetical protein